MKKRINLLVLFIVSSFVLVGFGANTVTLLRKSKVIDLQKAIEFAKPGGDEGEKADTTAKDNPDKKEVPEPVNTEIQAGPTSVKIIVSGKTIKIDGAIVNNPDLVESKIREIFKVENTYELLDDYAEAHVYKDVINVLAKLNQDIGLEYSVE